MKPRSPHRTHVPTDQGSTEKQAAAAFLVEDHMNFFKENLLGIFIFSVVSGLVASYIYTYITIQDAQTDSSAPRDEVRAPNWKPKLAIPQNGTTISQPYIQPWLFKWDEPVIPNSVKEYNIRVIGDKAAYPVIDANTTANQYVKPQACSYIVDRNSLGWKWQVRARFIDGNWSEWSPTSTFDVSPFDQNLFCQRCSRIDICGRK